MKLISLVVSCLLVSLSAAEEEERDNILFLLIDDWGIDSSPLDNPKGKDLPLMPNLMRLAGESVRFANAYVSPSCSPTRQAIMSGRLPANSGVGAPGSSSRHRNADSIMSIAEAMDHEKSAYVSGLFGKWHLGTGVTARGPAADGWDVFYGCVRGNIENYYDWPRQNLQEQLINQTGKASNEKNYATSVNVDDALDFIKTNEKWLCWIGFNAPHSPLDLPPLTLNGITYPEKVSANNRRQIYRAKLWALDNEIGRLLAGVDLETTTVILMGDNGTSRRVLVDENLFPASHGKTQIYDGGVHVPFLYRPAGGTAASVKTELINGFDLFPTICELMSINHVALKQPLDGISILPIIAGTDKAKRFAVSELYAYSRMKIAGRTIRYGDYKLNIHDDPLSTKDTPKVELFNLRNGLDESSAKNLLRSGYTLSTEEKSAYQELTAHNRVLNSKYKVRFLLQ